MFLSQKKNIQFRTTYRNKVRDDFIPISCPKNESDLSLSESCDLNVEDLEILKSVYGDVSRYTQIIQNFLSNAVKFTNDNGKIEVRVTVLEIQDIQSEERLCQIKEEVKEQLNILGGS